MSYSFSFKASTKQRALELATEHFDEMLKQQPAHERDRPAALANVQALVGLVNEPEAGHEIMVQMSGSVGWRYDEHDKPGPTISVNVSASVYLV